MSRRTHDLDVNLADGEHGNLTNNVIPLAVPAATKLHTFLRNRRRHRSQLPVATTGVVRFSGAPACIVHLLHALPSAAGPGARRMLPHKWRRLEREVDTLARRPEHLFARTRWCEPVAFRQVRICKR